MESKCVQCKEIKDILVLNKHSAYKDQQRYICKPCNAERVALRRNLQMYPQNKVSVSTNVRNRVSTKSEPVSAPIVDTNHSVSTESKEVIIARARAAIDALSKKPAPQEEFEDRHLISLKEETADYYL